MATDWGGVLDGLFSIGSAAIKGNARDDYADLLRGQEQQNYDTARQNYDAYNEYLTNVYGPAAAANAAARDRAAAAANAAARANEAARAAAAQKASKLLTKGYKRSMKMLRPSIDISNATIPMMGATYSKGVDGLNLLRAYMQSPQMMSRISESGKSPLSIDLGELPAHMKGK